MIVNIISTYARLMNTSLSDDHTKVMKRAIDQMSFTFKSLCVSDFLDLTSVLAVLGFKVDLS